MVETGGVHGICLIFFSFVTFRCSSMYYLSLVLLHAFAALCGFSAVVLALLAMFAPVWCYRRGTGLSMVPLYSSYLTDEGSMAPFQVSMIVLLTIGVLMVSLALLTFLMATLVFRRNEKFLASSVLFLAGVFILLAAAVYGGVMEGLPPGDGLGIIWASGILTIMSMICTGFAAHFTDEMKRVTMREALTMTRDYESTTESKESDRRTSR